MTPEQVDLVFNEALADARRGFDFYATAFTDIREGVDRGVIERSECVRQMWGWMCHLASLSSLAYDLHMEGLYLAIDDEMSRMRRVYHEAHAEVGESL